MSRQRGVLNQEQLGELQTAYEQSRDGATRTRCQAVRLYGEGYAVSEITTITQCSRSSLLGWWRGYQAQGVLALQDKRAGGNRAKLNHAELAELQERLHSFTPAEVLGTAAATPRGQHWTMADLQQAIALWYGVHYSSASSYPRLFKQCGFSYQRTEKVFRSRRPAAVMDWQEQLEKN